MKCPNCLKTFQKGVKCPGCGVDTVLYMATVRLSDKMHNQGLERLKNGDLYHGIQALTKSVAINKNNVPSRNLLGLALFEAGHIGEALKHWIISQSMLKEDNPATKYIENAHKNARQLERLNDAAYMFNQALGHIKQKSDDLAIIQLKKAVEINPRFVDALNLLTLCYLIQNDRDRATATAERVLSIDAFNPIAQNYYSILNPGKKPPRLSTTKQKTTPVNKPYKALGIDEKKQRSFHLSELLTFLIGVACTFAACYFLLYPALESGHESDLQIQAEILADTQNEYRAELARLESDIEELEQRVSEKEAENERFEEKLSYEERINQVNHAYLSFLGIGSAANEENLAALRRIVNTLEDFDHSDLPSDIIQRVTTIIDDAYPRIGTDYYNAGLSSFNAPRDSYMARQHLENARRFLREDSAQWNRLLFMLGTLYYDEDDLKDEAFAVLSELRQRAPNLPSPFTGTERTAFNNMMSSLEG